MSADAGARGARRGEWPLERLLSEVVGSGPKSAGDMTREQADEALHRVLDGDPDPTTLGAFWLANRWKGNTPEELAAFVDVMRERSVRTAAPDADPVDCGANYDGKRRTALLGVAAGIVAAAAGTPVVVHSADRVPTTRGDAYRHVLDALGIETALAPPASARMVDETGFGFYDATRCNPLVDDLLERRERVAVRTFLNTIETLANPADASVHLGSFYHLAFAKRVIAAIDGAHSLDVERVLMVQGLEGYDDVRPGYTKLAEWRDGTVVEDEIETGEFGMDVDEAALEVDDVAVDSARITERVVEGEAEGPFADAVALNAGLRVYAGDGADTLGAGLERARSAIADGRAAAVLDRLRTFGP